MSLKVRLAQPLRSSVGGQTSISLEAATLADLVVAIRERYPELAERIVRDGGFGPFVTVFVDGEDARYLEPDADLRAARQVEILPAMSGGAVPRLQRGRRGVAGEAVRVREGGRVGVGVAERDSILERLARDVHGSFIDETIGIVARATRDTVSFAVGSPAREALARVGAAELAARVLEREGPSALGYTITEGEPELREIVAADARERGIRCDPENVIVTAGALQAIDIACRLFIEPGDVAVVESPGFANALSALRNQGARLLEVPVDDEGMDVAAAVRSIRESGAHPKLFFVVPNFQNPTGATLSHERREALLSLAQRYGAVVVEDDPYRELRYRGGHLPALGALASDGVVHVGSFSKVFLPGLRVGWAIADPRTIRRMAAAKQTMDSSTGTLGQRLVVEFHRAGRVAEHLDALRALYGAKQQRARAALAREFADGAHAVRWNDPEGGFYFWVRVPVDARRLLDVALEEGVAFVPGAAFAVTRDHAKALRFSYSSPSLERIDEGVRRLRRAVDRVVADPGLPRRRPDSAPEAAAPASEGGGVGGDLGLEHVPPVTGKA